MFNRKSRTLAFAMSLALVFGLCPAVALAEGEGDPDEEEPVLVVQDDGKIDLADVYDNTGLQAYDGDNPITAKLQLVYYGSGSGKALVVDEDYTITQYLKVADGVETEVAAPAEEGDYIAVVTGQGAYTGTKRVSFKVSGCKDFHLVEANQDSTLVYTGEVQYPELTITYEGETLVRGVNYELGEVVKLTTGTADDQGTPAEPIEVGSYRVKLIGKESGGYTGWFWEYFSIVAGNDFKNATVSGFASSYPYTGQAIDPAFTVKLPNGTALQKGVDYEYYYTLSGSENQSATTPIEPGYYSLHLVGKGDYAGLTNDGRGGVRIIDPAFDLSQATVSGFAIRYPYTGKPVPAIPKVTLGAKDLTVNYGEWDEEATPDCRILVRRTLSGQVLYDFPAIVAPGHYYISVFSGGNGYTGTRHRVAEFYIYDPNTTVEGDLTTEVDSKTGVAVAGTLFDEMNVDGNEVRVSVEDVASSNPTRSADLERRYKDEDAEFFKVIDVNLDLLNSEGDVIAPLTEQLNKLNLTFPVDEALNGRTATIVQLHKNAATGATEEIRMTAPVVDGGVTVTVDQLSEFVVSVEPEGEGGNNSGNGETVTRPASALPNTGDNLPLPGMLFAAALAAGASIVALRHATIR